MRNRVKILFVFLLGVAVFISPPVILSNFEGDSCGNQIYEVDKDETYDHYNSEIEYPQLSKEGKTVVKKALSSDDNSVSVSSNNCPNEFSYPGDATGYYLIINNDTYYNLQTYGSSPGLYSLESLQYGLDPIRIIVGVALVLLSIILLLKEIRS